MTIARDKHDPNRARPTAARRGRPPAQEAGQAAERILETATALFLEQGFGRTTLDQVAAKANTGKSSIYGHFRDKETLFGAVVRRSIETMFAEMAPAPESATLEEKLHHVGWALAQNLLLRSRTAMMRVTVAEAELMPDVVRSYYRFSMEGAIVRVRAILDSYPFFGELDTASIANRFIELALQPLSFQAVYGADLSDLRVKAADHVDDAILLLKTKNLLPQG